MSRRASSLAQRWNSGPCSRGVARGGCRSAPLSSSQRQSRVRSTAAAPTLTDKDTIVLADFTNTTGDPVFDDTLRQGLAVQLQQSPFLSLISDDRIRRTLPLMNQPADARLTPDIARVVCVRTASAAVLRRIDCGARQSVRPRPARHELHDRRHPRRRAGAGVTKRRCPEHAQSDGDAVPDASR